MTTAPRPRVHHTPVSGWVNDPLGLTFHGGRYHLFFQYVPDRTTWDVGCHWGHATSDDLLTWTPEPSVLAPDESEDGVWSGNLVRTGSGETVVFYTAVDADDREIGRVRRAVPTDDSWQTWTKEDVVVRLPEGEPAVAFRDPFVYADGAGWRMLMGGGLPGGVPVVWMFTSPDLRTWTYAGRAAEGGPGPATIWECPVLVDVDGRQVLVVSDCEPGAPLQVSYAWVRADGDRLVPGAWRRLGYGALVRRLDVRRLRGAAGARALGARGGRLRVGRRDEPAAPVGRGRRSSGRPATVGAGFRSRGWSTSTGTRPRASVLEPASGLTLVAGGRVAHRAVRGELGRRCHGRAVRSEWCSTGRCSRCSASTGCWRCRIG